MATPRGPSLVASSREMIWRSTRNCRSRVERPLTSMIRELELGVSQGRAEVGLDLGFLAAAGAIGKREIGQVAGQPDPRAHHDVALGAGAPQPLAGRFRQVVESHAWGSFGRSRSRSRAASSYSSRAIASRSRVRIRSRSMAPSRRRATLPTWRVAPWNRCKSGVNPLEKTQ